MKHAVFVREKALRRHGLAHPCLIVIGLFVPAVDALEQAIVPLCVKQAAFVKARPLELMVHIGGDDKVILPLHQLQQVPVHRSRRVNISVEIDMPCPPSPAGLLIREGIEAPGIQIRDAEALFEIEETAFKPLAAVGQSGGGGQPGACPDDNGIRCFQLRFQPLQLRLPVSGAEGRGGAEGAQGVKTFLNGLLIPVGSLME